MHGTREKTWSRGSSRCKSGHSGKQRAIVNFLDNGIKWDYSRKTGPGGFPMNKPNAAVVTPEFSEHEGP